MSFPSTTSELSSPPVLDSGGWLMRRLRQLAASLPLGLLIFGLINAGLESGIVRIELVPFVLGCCLLRLALFRDSPLLPQGALA